jgi:regulatory protein
MKQRKPLTKEQLRERMEELCAMSEYSSAEIMQRLRRGGLSATDATEVVQGLIDRKFIDDERYAHAFIRSKASAGCWGKRKIRQALRLKQISSALIDQAMEEELDDERYYDMLAATLRTKARTMPEKLDAVCRDKLLRFAASRGFEPGLIMEMIPEEDFWRNECY